MPLDLPVVNSLRTGAPAGNPQSNNPSFSHADASSARLPQDVPSDTRPPLTTTLEPSVRLTNFIEHCRANANLQDMVAWFEALPWLDQQTLEAAAGHNPALVLVDWLASRAETQSLVVEEAQLLHKAGPGTSVESSRSICVSALAEGLEDLLNGADIDEMTTHPQGPAAWRQEVAVKLWERRVKPAIAKACGREPCAGSEALDRMCGDFRNLRRLVQEAQGVDALAPFLTWLQERPWSALGTLADDCAFSPLAPLADWLAERPEAMDVATKQAGKLLEEARGDPMWAVFTDPRGKATIP